MDTDASSKKRKRQASTKKDPNAPKYPRTGYNRYCDSERQNIKDELNTNDSTLIERELGKRWKELDTAKKEEFNESFRRDKEIYKQQLKEYNEKNQQSASNSNDDDDAAISSGDATAAATHHKKQKMQPSSNNNSNNNMNIQNGVNHHHHPHQQQASHPHHQHHHQPPGMHPPPPFHPVGDMMGAPSSSSSSSYGAPHHHHHAQHPHHQAHEFTMHTNHLQQQQQQQQPPQQHQQLPPHYSSNHGAMSHNPYDHTHHQHQQQQVPYHYHQPDQSQSHQSLPSLTQFHHMQTPPPQQQSQQQHYHQHTPPPPQSQYHHMQQQLPPIQQQLHSPHPSQQQQQQFHQSSYMQSLTSPTQQLPPMQHHHHEQQQQQHHPYVTQHDQSHFQPMSSIKNDRPLHTPDIGSSSPSSPPLASTPTVPSPVSASSTNKSASTTTAGGKEKKKKQLRDPNAPAKPLSGYQQFCKEKHSEIQKENPDMKSRDVMKELGKCWKSLSEEDKSVYNDAYAERKQLYDAEMKKYKASLAAAAAANSNSASSGGKSGKKKSSSKAQATSAASTAQETNRSSPADDEDEDPSLAMMQFTNDNLLSMNMMVNQPTNTGHSHAPHHPYQAPPPHQQHQQQPHQQPQQQHHHQHHNATGMNPHAQPVNHSHGHHGLLPGLGMPPPPLSRSDLEPIDRDQLLTFWRVVLCQTDSDKFRAFRDSVRCFLLEVQPEDDQFAAYNKSLYEGEKSTCYDDHQSLVRYINSIRHLPLTNICPQIDSSFYREAHTLIQRQRNRWSQCGEKMWLDEYDCGTFNDSDGSEEDDDANVAERKSWKDYGMDIHRLEIGSFAPVKNYRGQFRLKVDCNNRLLYIYLHNYVCNPNKYMQSKNPVTQLYAHFNDFKVARRMRMCIPIDNIIGVHMHTDHPTKKGVLILKISHIPHFETQRICALPTERNHWRTRADFTANEQASRHQYYYFLADEESMLYTVALLSVLSQSFHNLYSSRQSLGAPEQLIDNFAMCRPSWDVRHESPRPRTRAPVTPQPIPNSNFHVPGGEDPCGGYDSETDRPEFARGEDFAFKSPHAPPPPPSMLGGTGHHHPMGGTIGNMGHIGVNTSGGSGGANGSSTMMGNNNDPSTPSNSNSNTNGGNNGGNHAYQPDQFMSQLMSSDMNRGPTSGNTSVSNPWPFEF